MNKLLIATRNPGKLLEIANFLSDLPIKTVSLSDLGIKENVEETGKTYRENSVKKAKFYAKLSGLPTISDDGGIEIDALGGAPGIRSRRFFAPRSGVSLRESNEATDEEIIEAMTMLINNTPVDKRGAQFKDVVTFCLPNGQCFSRSGSVYGILKSQVFPRRLKGYPYRSFFYLPKIQKYYHEDDLSEKEQKRYNHRYKAIQKLIPVIKRLVVMGL